MKLIDYIRKWNNIINEKTLDSFKTYLKSSLPIWEPGKVVGNSTDGTGQINTNIRKVDLHQLFNNSKSLTNVHWHNFFQTTFHKCLQKYASETNVQLEVSKYWDLSVLRYNKTGFYTPHFDHSVKNVRTLSLIYLINDDYEGGELKFHGIDRKEVIYKLPTEKNSLVMWPSNFVYPHSVSAVTKGIRYSLVGWVQ
jgi:Golgi nucleoside diphosphatase